jgi:hypothetical protein
MIITRIICTLLDKDCISKIMKKLKYSIRKHIYNKLIINKLLDA